jgi:hypothetical protein
VTARAGLTCPCELCSLVRVGPPVVGLSAVPPSRRRQPEKGFYERRPAQTTLRAATLNFVMPATSRMEALSSSPAHQHVKSRFTNMDGLLSPGKDVEVEWTSVQRDIAPGHSTFAVKCEPGPGRWPLEVRLQGDPEVPGVPTEYSIRMILVHEPKCR